MLRSLRARLFGSMVLVTAVVVGATLAIADSLFDERAHHDARAELDAIAREALTALAQGSEPAAIADREQAAAIAIFGPDGALLARDPSVRPLDPSELARIRRLGQSSAEVREVRGARWMYLWATDGEGRVVRAARPLPPTSAALETLRHAVLVAAIFALLVALLLSEYLTRSIGQPVREMMEAADALRSGELTRRVRSQRRDELGALGRAVDQMADQLVERFEAVQREKARLRTILDSMVEGVFVTDAEGRIVLTNAALVALAGGEVEGRTAIEAIRSPELHAAVRRATLGENGEVELELGAGATRRSITAHVAPLPTGQGVVAVLHDVTQLKRADKVRRDFVANASHELRTPLTSIRGFAETLLDGALSDARMARRFVGNIAENARRLQSLVEDLLELSRAESPESRVELEPVDVGIVAAQVLSDVEQRAADKRIQLALEGAGTRAAAMADPRALDQVLLNLVDNAIKYTPEGGRVTVRVEAREGRVVLAVADNGPGIPEKHLDRIFERFYRVDKGRARAQGGTGLGLSIVRHLVGRMEGEVAVESRVGEGSTFSVTLSAA